MSPNMRIFLPNITESSAPVTTFPITIKSTNHQNSDLDARPEKETYFLKQIDVESKKFILPSELINFDNSAMGCV